MAALEAAPTSTHATTTFSPSPALSATTCPIGSSISGAQHWQPPQVPIVSACTTSERGTISTVSRESGIEIVVAGSCSLTTPHAGKR